MDTPDFDLEVKTRSGERMWVNVSTLVFEEPRRNRHLVVHLARDISHRKKSEELLAKMLAISKEVVAVADHNTRVAPVSPLSEQEQRILRLFAKAKNSSEIARDLGITLPTLRNHSAQHQRETAYSQSPGSRDARHATRPHLDALFAALRT